MTYVRRTRYLFLRPRDDGALVGVSVLTGREVDLSDEDANALLGVPADRWTRADEAGDSATVRRLVEHGLVVSDEQDERLVELRRRDERLTSPPWNRYAALFHSLTRWSGVQIALEEPPVRTSRPKPVRWRPPHHFHAVAEARAVVPLLPGDREGRLYDILRARKTTRAYEPSATLSLEELSSILKLVWGCHGFLRLGEDFAMLKKTSPSGGAQHPVEVYPLVRAVDGIDPGIYHYSVERHVLELVEPLPSADAAELIDTVTAGQHHYADAQVLFMMAARFARNHWKYPAHAKAFRTLLMDAAHLNQTLYLVCTELGLGAFVTGAINDADVDRRLGLDEFGESVLLASGCGRPAPSEREPRFEPYVAPASTGT